MTGLPSYPLVVCFFALGLYVVTESDQTGRKHVSHDVKRDERESRHARRDGTSRGPGLLGKFFEVNLTRSSLAKMPEDAGRAPDKDLTGQGVAS